MRLPVWAVCPTCFAPHREAVCPRCDGATAAAVAPPATTRESSARPVDRPPTPGVAVGGIALGALGLVPLLGLTFSLLGVILSLAALRAVRRRQQRPTLAYVGLAVSFATAIPGVLLWGWLQAAAAAW